MKGSARFCNALMRFSGRKKVNFYKRFADKIHSTQFHSWEGDMRRFQVLCGCIVLTGCSFLFQSSLAGQASGAGGGVDRPSDEGFVPIFDGKTLKGWHLSGRTVHGRGGRWEVKDGAIVGCQDFRGDGGVLMTDALYGNYEIALEMNNNFGTDSGLFLRSTEEGCAYQALIDYHSGKIHGWNWDGSPMGIFGERLWRQERPDPRFYGGDPYLYNFVFDQDPSKIRPREGVRLPVSPDEWPRFWKHGLQVHGGGDMTKLFVRYRNIRVKQLD